MTRRQESAKKSLANFPNTLNESLEYPVAARPFCNFVFEVRKAFTSSDPLRKIDDCGLAARSRGVEDFDRFSQPQVVTLTYTCTLRPDDDPPMMRWGKIRAGREMSL